MKTFTPHLKALPLEQQILWPELESVPKEFVLYGGTALALRLGHRISVDFDFFSSEPFQVAELERRLPFFVNAQVSQRAANTLTFTVARGRPIKLSFFGGLTFGRIGEPEMTDDQVMSVASLLDLAGTKASVVQVRAEAKDYRDIFALIQAGLRLELILAAGRALYEERFNPLITLKALTYFRDGDLVSLAEEEKRSLVAAVEHLGPLPVLNRASARLAG